MSVSEHDELPSGIVTFVLTDIEGSTRLFRRLGDAYSGLLLEHHRRLRASFSAWRGAELGTEGDSFLVAFADALSAVRACVDVQRSVGEHLSGPPAAIRVRIGVHTGPATPVGDGYVSLSIHQTARISAAAHGGQVLLSDVTAAAVGERLTEDNIRIEDLGLYQLRDFPEPQRLFQVAGTGMQSQFPPLRTLSVLAHNLPFMSTSFVGREEERSSLRSVLHERRLVTIVGPGGVGKTRLAIETGHEALNQFADGVWLVDLAAVTEPHHVAQAVASALGVSPRTGAATASVVDALRPKRALLILDNCEHLVDVVASLVEELLGHCPHLRILATSREALNIDGESARQLRPMSLPPLHAQDAAIESDAMQLFLDRAAQAGAQLDGRNAVAAQVADIVTRLDGLPLAIELAAATLQHLGLEELRIRLAARFELLSRGRRTAPARHRTLAAVIQWGFDLLSVDERGLFIQLSTFRDGWTADAAAVVCTDDIAQRAVPALLESLCGKSLVVHEPGSSRFAMLETIREFAAAKLEEAAGPRAAARRRYAKWCVDVAEHGGARLVGPDRRAAMQMLVDEEGNLRDALVRAMADGDIETGLRLAIALEPFWLAHGRWDDAAESLDALLSAPCADMQLAARARVAVANLHLFDGRYDSAKEMLGRAHELAGVVGDTSTTARALSGLGYVSFRASRLEEAEVYWSQALLVCQEGGDEWLEANILRSLAIAAGTRGDQILARRLLSDATRLARDVEDDQLLRLVLSSSAEINLWLGRYGTALEQYEESLRLATFIGDHTGRAVIMAELGWLEYLSGHYEQAEELATEAMELAEALPHLRALVNALRVLGEVASGRGNADDARRFLERSVSAAREFGSPAEIGGALCSLACRHLDQLVLDQARSVALEVLALKPLPHTMKRATPEWVLGEVARLQGAFAEARSRFETELEAATSALIVHHEAQALRGLADVARADHDLDGATALHQQALRLRSDIQDRLGVADSLVGIASVSLDAGAPKRAACLLQAADACRQSLGVALTPRETVEVRRVRADIDEHLGSEAEAHSWTALAPSEGQVLDFALEDPASEIDEARRA